MTPDPTSTASRDPSPSPTQRLIAFVAYVVVLWMVGGVVTGVWLPSGGGGSLWFMSAVGLWLFTTLGAPFFARPRDALANAVIVGFVLFTVDLSSVAQFRQALEWFRWLAFTLAVAVGIAGSVAIWLYAKRPPVRGRREVASKVCHRIATQVGTGSVLFTLPALLSIFGFHQQAPASMLWLAFVWVFAVSTKPVELILRLYNLFHVSQEPAATPNVVGRINRVDSPNLIRVALDAPETWRKKRLHVACFPDGAQVEVIPLFEQMQENGLVGTGFCHQVPSDPLADPTPGYVFLAASQRETKDVIAELAGGDDSAELIGFVVEDSTIGAIRFELSTSAPLEEGALLFVRQRDAKVYYQILDVRTSEESFWQNPYGKQVVSAGQLGVLSNEKGFVKHPWVPRMNSPVFLAGDGSTSPATAFADDDDRLVLGTVPNTAVCVPASFSDMLEYHTAILGVTGTGKTELCFDIVRKALGRGAKVFCVDFTGEYWPRLSDCNPVRVSLSDDQCNRLEQLYSESDGLSFGTRRDELMRNLRELERSSLNEVRNTVDAFLSIPGSGLAVFELPEISNTKGCLAVTQFYLSAVFRWAQEHRRAKQILVVLEEAHTIIPEAQSLGFDKPTQLTVGKIAQIALQGRKYGVGLLLVSQRTALVSKTLLSQCNTVLSFAMHDKTGLDYLSSVFSTDHVRAIPNLRFLQGIAFGKAIHSERPIIFEMPWSEEKKKASDALNKSATPEPDPPAPADTSVETAEDGIPF